METVSIVRKEPTLMKRLTPACSAIQSVQIVTMVNPASSSKPSGLLPESLSITESISLVDSAVLNAMSK